MFVCVLTYSVVYKFELSTAIVNYTFKFTFILKAFLTHTSTSRCFFISNKENNVCIYNMFNGFKKQEKFSCWLNFSKLKLLLIKLSAVFPTYCSCTSGQHVYNLTLSQNYNPSMSIVQYNPFIPWLACVFAAKAKWNHFTPRENSFLQT